MRYAQITGSLIWYGMLENEIWRCRLRHRKPSLNKLALLYPTDHDHKLRMNSTKSDACNASRTCWSRIRNGHIVAPQGSFLKRIDDDFPHLKVIRHNPLCSLLGDPFDYHFGFSQLIADVKPKLNGKLFLIDKYSVTKTPNIQHQPLKWNQKNCRLVESTESLALKMALYQQNDFSQFCHPWPQVISIRDLILHLFRIISHAPWSYAPDRLIRLFWIFILGNRKNVSVNEVENALISHDTDTIFRNIYQLLYSKPHIPPRELPTLNQYLKTNQLLVNNAWNTCFPSVSNRPPYSRCSRETLFLADTFADVWISQTIPKDQLFNEYPPFQEILNECWFHRSRHRIW